MENILKKEIVLPHAITTLLGISVFVLLTALGAFIRFPLPFTPVPITLQTFFVLLSGAFLGSRKAGFAQTLYILLGGVGIPLFAGGVSAPSFFGPTIGYLFGFLIAAVCVGRWISKTNQSFMRLFFLFFIASLMILASGVLWLKVLYGLPLTRLLWIGFIPFLPGDALKALAAAVVFSKLKSRFKTTD